MIETDFTPLWSFVGGAMIGLSALILMVMLGRVAGISGIVGQLMAEPTRGSDWRLAFLLGMVLAGPLAMLVTGAWPVAVITDNLPLLIIAGLVVGIGTRMGSGCTSGHGICGLARFSTRSLVGTLTFMATAFLTVYVTRHLLGA